jgi:hypothetical protein
LAKATYGKPTAATVECVPSQSRDLIQTDGQNEHSAVHPCLNLKLDALGQTGLLGLDH